MVDQTDSGRPEGPPEQATTEAAVQDTVQEWVALGKQAGAAASTLGKLLGAELKLAGADTGRLIAVGLILLCVASMAWFGLSVLIAWLAYGQLDSVTLALLVFIVVQVVAILILVKAAMVFKRSLGLPATKRNVRAIVDSARTTRSEVKEPSDGTQRQGT